MAGDNVHASEVPSSRTDPYENSFWYIIPSLMFFAGVIFLVPFIFSVLLLRPNLDSLPNLIIWFFLTFLISTIIYLFESIASLKKSVRVLSDRLDQLSKETEQ
jgi:glycopeptide antibiotics resistance protein